MGLYDPAPAATPATTTSLQIDRPPITRHEIDARLRGWGYRIWIRPRSGQPWWMNPEGVLVTQAAALEEVVERAALAAESATAATTAPSRTSNRRPRKGR